MMMMMMNCFCMVDRRKAFSFISSRDHCQRSSPSRVSNMPRAGFEPVQNLSSGLAEWSCAVVITATPRRHMTLCSSDNHYTTAEVLSKIKILKTSKSLGPCIIPNVKLAGETWSWYQLYSKGANPLFDAVDQEDLFLRMLSLLTRDVINVERGCVFTKSDNIIQFNKIFFQDLLIISKNCY